VNYLVFNLFFLIMSFLLLFFQSYLASLQAMKFTCLLSTVHGMSVFKNWAKPKLVVLTPIRSKFFFFFGVVFVTTYTVMCCIIPHNFEVKTAQFSRYTTYRNSNMKWLSSPRLYRVFLPYSKRGKCLLSNFSDRWQSGGIMEFKLISIMSLVNS